MFKKDDKRVSSMYKYIKRAIKTYPILKWLIVIVFIFSSILFIRVYSKNYISEVRLRHGLPLAIVVGMTSIAIAIFEKK